MDRIEINPQLFSSFPPDSRDVVGISGGRDSIVLLHLCSSWVIAD
jgi:tRNA(Ile)-lysidine synthase TilS/MesJ